MGHGDGTSVAAGAGAAGTARAAGKPRPAGRRPPNGRAPLRGEHVAEIQRSRLLAGAVEAIEELGYARTTVAQITSRAGVSRGAFYGLFDDCEACLKALLDDVVETVAQEIAAESLHGAGWRERVRGGLGAILSFLDREPALARFCVVHALHGGPEVLERRERALARLAWLLDEGRRESTRGEECSPLVAEGLVAAAAGILYTRLLRGERRPLRELQGELMGMIVLPYLGPAAARRERTRPASATSRTPAPTWSDRDLPRDTPLRMTYRTALALECIAEEGERGSAPNNRTVSQHAGISDPGQISKLLRRLERLGLVANGRAERSRGEPNAWTLTPLGRRVTQGIRARAGRETSGQVAR
jgi:AcrR family transcriptional regulator